MVEATKEEGTTTMPKTDTTKSRQITVRLTDDQSENLALASDFTGKDQSELIRDAIERVYGDIHRFAKAFLEEKQQDVEEALRNRGGG